MDPFLAEIVLFAGNFAPRGWAYCDGQLMSINANPALFSLLGTTYGGDGRTTFAVPDLRGRTPIGPRQGPGLTDYNLGQRGGVETVTLTINQIPSHNHIATVTPGSAVLPVNGTAGSEDSSNPVGHVLTNFGTDAYTSEAPTGNYGAAAPVTGTSVAVLNQGGSQWHTNIQPFLAINYIICTQGTFPSRN